MSLDESRLLKEVNNECLNKITELEGCFIVKDGKVYLKDVSNPYDVIAAQHKLFERGQISGLHIAMDIIYSKIKKEGEKDEETKRKETKRSKSKEKES